MLDYKVMEGSLYNTPPCWSIYVCGLVFKHMLALVRISVVQAVGFGLEHWLCGLAFQALLALVHNSTAFYGCKTRHAMALLNSTLSVWSWVLDVACRAIIKPVGMRCEDMTWGSLHWQQGSSPE